LKHKFLVFLFLSIFLFSCKKESEEDNKETLTILNSYSIDVKEPSGLTFDKSRNILYTVSDNSNKIYKLGLTGTVFQEYNYVGEDLEGICIDKDKNLVLVEERKRQIVEYNTSTKESKFHNLEIEVNEANSGLEGITFNSKDNTFFVLNEKNPGLLLVVDQSFKIEAKYNLDFASDYSGICYDANEDLIWVVSDQSKTLTKCQKNGDMIKQYRLSIDKVEGIAIDAIENVFYMISDSRDELYKIDIPK